jgi:hypothetical protein
VFTFFGNTIIPDCQIVLLDLIRPFNSSALNHASFGFPECSKEIQTCRVLTMEGHLDPWDLLIRNNSDPSLQWAWLGCLAPDLCLWAHGQDEAWFNLDSRDCHGWTLLEIAVELWLYDASFRLADQSEWIRPVKWLIKNGSNLHRRGRRQHTILAYLSYRTTNFEVIVQKWFDILRDCGVDITTYLQKEKQIYEGVIIAENRYIHENSKFEEIQRRLIFIDNPTMHPGVYMSYVPLIRPGDEELPLFIVYGTLLSLSEYRFAGLFSASLHHGAWIRERRKEKVRETREQEGKLVHMVRRRRKLLARLATPRTCWPKTRSQARLAIQAEEDMMIDYLTGPDECISGKTWHFWRPFSAFMNVIHGIFTFKYHSLSSCILFLLLTLSFGANILLFHLLMLNSMSRDIAGH